MYLIFRMNKIIHLVEERWGAKQQQEQCRRAKWGISNDDSRVKAMKPTRLFSVALRLQIAYTLYALPIHSLCFCYTPAIQVVGCLILVLY